MTMSVKSLEGTSQSDILGSQLDTSVGRSHSSLLDFIAAGKRDDGLYSKCMNVNIHF